MDSLQNRQAPFVERTGVCLSRTWFWIVVLTVVMLLAWAVLVTVLYTTDSLSLKVNQKRSSLLGPGEYVTALRTVQLPSGETQAATLIQGYFATHALYSVRTPADNTTAAPDLLWVDYQQQKLYVMASHGHVSGGVMSPVLANSHSVTSPTDTLTYEATLSFYSADPASPAAVDEVYVRWLPGPDLNSGTLVVHADRPLERVACPARLLQLDDVGLLVAETFHTAARL